MLSLLIFLIVWRVSHWRSLRSWVTVPAAADVVDFAAAAAAANAAVLLLQLLLIRQQLQHQYFTEPANQYNRENSVVFTAGGMELYLEFSQL